MSITLDIYSPISISFISYFNNVMAPSYLNEEGLQIVYDISKNFPFQVWNSEDLDKTITNIENNLPNEFSYVIVNNITLYCTDLLPFFHRGHMTYTCINEQCMYLAYRIFLGYIIRLIHTYCVIHEIVIIDGDVLRKIFLETSSDDKDFIIDGIDYSPIHKIMAFEFNKIK